MLEIDNINAWLAEFCGKNFRQQQIFRLVFSDLQYEWRHGTYRDFSTGGLFIREVTEDRYTKKCPYIQSRWILEKWAPPEMVKNDDLPNWREGDYVPFYVFEDKHGNALEPTRKVVEFIFYCTMRNNKPRTQQEIMNEIMIKEDQEVQDFMDQIDTSEIGNALRLRQAVGYSGKAKYPEKVN